MRHVPLLVLSILVLATVGGSLTTLDQGFLGRYYVDAWGTQWFYWFTQQSVLRESVAQTSLFFYPWGKDVYGHTGGNVLDAVLAAPLRSGLGPALGYNVFVALLVLSNAWGMKKLLVELKMSPWTGWLTGALFAFNPFLLTEIRDGRPTQAMLVFALLFWTYWLRAAQGWKPVVAAGVFLALTGLTYWYYAILAAPAALAVTALDREPKAVRNRVAAGGLAGLLVLPFALGMLTSDKVPGLLDVSKWGLTTWSPMTLDGMPVGILAFDPLRRMSGFWVEDPDGTRIFTPEWVSMLRVQVALVALGVWFAPRRLRLVGLCILLPSLLVALGPEWMGVPNTPYLVAVKLIRVLQRLWWPARALVYVHVGLMLLTAPFWERLVTLPRTRAVLAVGTALLWSADLKVAVLSPMPMWSAKVPTVYECLAKDTERAPVFELPYAYTQAHLYYQTVHAHPIFGGMIEDNKIFTPEPQQKMRSDNTFVKGLIDLADAKNPAEPVTDEDKKVMGELGYRWVVLDKLPYRNPPPFPEARPRTHYPEVRAALEAILGKPVFEDRSGVIWAPWGGSSPCPDAEASEKKSNGPRLRRRTRTNGAEP